MPKCRRSHSRNRNGHLFAQVGLLITAMAILLLAIASIGRGADPVVTLPVSPGWAYDAVQNVQIDATGQIKIFDGPTSFSVTLDPETLTADRTHVLPDTDGRVWVDTAVDDIERLVDGAAIETVDVDVVEDGGAVKLQLQADGGGDITFRFAGLSYTLDCTPVCEVTLAAGTDPAPDENFSYVTESGGVLTLENSTSGFPAGPHAPVATTVIQSAANVAIDGAFKVHVWTDHLYRENENGHLYHLNKKVRQRHADHETGVAPSDLVVSSPDAYIATTAGTVSQLHVHTMPARDMQAGDAVRILNDPTTNNKRITTFDDITQDASGGGINNKYMNVVLWGVASENEFECKLFLNLPTDTYVVEAAAQQDTENTTVYAFPAMYKGAAFLIARYTLQAKDSGAWSQSQKVDLRPLFPSTSAGGGGITEHGGLFGLTDDDHYAWKTILADSGSAVANAAPDTLTIVGDGTYLETSITGDTLTVAVISTGFTEAELETALSDVTNVYTNNDVVPDEDGGTGQSTYARGDIIVATAPNTLGKLPLATAGYVYASDGTDVVGVDPTHTIGGATHSDSTIMSIAPGELLKWNGAAWINNTLAEADISAASDAATHAAAGDAHQTQIHDVDGADHTGALTEAKGGTSESTYARGDMLVATAANTLGKLPLATAGYVYASDGTDIVGADPAHTIASHTDTPIKLAASDGTPDPALSTDAVGAVTAVGDLAAQGGTIDFGVEDTQSSLVNIAGHATGSTVGGKLRIKTAADHDTTDEYFEFQVRSDDMWIAPSGGAALTIVKNDGDWEFGVDVRIKGPTQDVYFGTNGIGTGGAATSGKLIDMTPGGGTGYTAGGDWLVTSSRDLKTSIGLVSSRRAWRKLDDLKPRRYLYKTQLDVNYSGSMAPHIGFILDELPADITRGMDGVSALRLATWAIAALKEEKRRGVVLKNRVDYLQGRLEAIEETLVAAARPSAGNSTTYEPGYLVTGRLGLRPWRRGTIAMCVALAFLAIFFVGCSWKHTTLRTEDGTMRRTSKGFRKVVTAISCIVVWLLFAMLAMPAGAEEPESVLTTVSEDVEDRRGEIEGLIAEHKDTITTSQRAVHQLELILGEDASIGHAVDNAWLKIQDLPSEPILTPIQEYEMIATSVDDGRTQPGALGTAARDPGGGEPWALGAGVSCAGLLVFVSLCSRAGSRKYPFCRRRRGRFARHTNERTAQASP